MRHGGAVGTAMQFTKYIAALRSAVCDGLMAYNGIVMILEQRCFGELCLRPLAAVLHLLL